MLRIAALATAAALVACSPAAPAAPALSHDDLVLKAYDVPSEQASELQGIINGLLYVAHDQPRHGSASLAPSGQLLVAAPAAFHPGIADVVAKLKSRVKTRSGADEMHLIVGGRPIIRAVREAAR